MKVLFSAVALTVILSLSLLFLFTAASAFAAADDSEGTKVASDNHVRPHVNCQCAQTVKLPDNGREGHDIDIGDGLNHKIKIINKLFRSHSDSGSSSGSGGSALANKNNVPVLPATTTTIPQPTTINSSIPVCDGIIPGPCLDFNTHAIIP